MSFEPITFASDVTISDKLLFLADAVELKGKAFDWSKGIHCVGSVAKELTGEWNSIAALMFFGLSSLEARRLYLANGEDIGEDVIYFDHGDEYLYTGVVGAQTAARWIRKLAEKYK